MTLVPSNPTPSRFSPRATRAMAEMFDGVSPRYRLLNRIMTLGQDRAWRGAMWLAVPEDARVVLDLCTGEGSSLGGLRRLGRLVIGCDASLGMLVHAADSHYRRGWAPRLVCGDAFTLPLRDGSIDAITIAFGMRNLRPHAEAVAELARVLRPDGTLAVLEATAHRSGPLASLQRFYLRRVIPAMGHLSPDPSAYRYLGESILEFAGGEAFTSAAEAAGFRWVSEQSFLLGATRLWVARRLAGGDENASTGDRPAVQSARMGERTRGVMPTSTTAARTEQRVWIGLQAALSLILTGTLGYALAYMRNPSIDIPLPLPHKRMLEALIVAGMVAFGIRAVVLALRFLQPPARR